MTNLTSLSQVRQLAAGLDLHPSKVMGQNFLIDLNILDILIRAADVSSQDTVLEIGPGFGVVTERLVAAGRSVVAVEKDRRLFGFLQGHFQGEKKLELMHADMTELDAAALLARHGVTRVVSNLPYSVGTRILLDLATIESPPERMTVTVQDEVADRLVAGPGTRDYGMVTVWCRLAYDIERVKRISSGCFWPRPDVSSCIVRFTRREALAPLADRQAACSLSKLAFGHRRKQLASILAGMTRGAGSEAMPADEFRALFEGLDIPGNARPENLGADEWLALSRSVRMD